jgi:hypothetical protein
MRHLYAIISAILCFTTLTYAQLTITVQVTELRVTNFCDNDGFGNGDSDPQWDISLDDNRGYSRSISHEVTNNGPTVSLTSGYPALNFSKTYGNGDGGNPTCPPNFLFLDWSAFEDDGLSTDCRVDRSFSWNVPTTPGTYPITRTASTSSDCNCTPTWSISLSMVVSGTPHFLCADAPCAATTQTIQDPCDATLNYFEYDVSNSTQTFSGASTACSWDENLDIFFSVTAPPTGSFTMWVDDWGDYGAATQANLTGNLYEGNCGALSIAGAPITIDGIDYTHSNDCIDFSSGLFNDYNEGPFRFDNLTPGETYYIRVTEEDDQNAWVGLAFAESLLEDDCENAQPLSGEGCNYNADDNNEPDDSSWTGQAHTDGRDVNGDAVLDDIDNCSSNWFSNENMVWYEFEVTAATAQPITIDILNVNCDNTGGGQMQMGIWRQNGATCPASANSGNGLGAMIPVGCQVGTGTVSVTMPDNMPYDTYYVIVDGDAGAQCVWEFASSEVLPVELESFNGYAEEGANVLDWMTASETNNSHFEIQRSSDPSKEFKTIGEVKGQGDSTQPFPYRFLDSAPPTSGYYRLKQVDFEVGFEYTKVIHILRKAGRFDISHVYPNPTLSVVNVKYVTLESITLNFNITDLLGRVVSRETIDVSEGLQTKELDVSHLSDGVYTLVVDDGISKKREKIVKK